MVDQIDPNPPTDGRYQPPPVGHPDNDDRRRTPKGATQGYYHGVGSSDFGLADSLGLPPPDLFFGSEESITISIGALRVVTLSNTNQHNEAEIERLSDKVKLSVREREEQRQIQADKLKEAEKGGLAGKIIGWIMVALSAVIGAVLVATGVGIAVGATLIAMALTTASVMLATDKELGQAMGLEGSLFDATVTAFAAALEKAGLDPEISKLVASAILVGTAAFIALYLGGPGLGVAIAAQYMTVFFTPENMEAMGMSEEDSLWASLGINIALQVISIIAAAAFTMGVGGIGTAASAAPNAAAQAGMAGAHTATVATQAATAIAEKIASVVHILVRLTQAAMLVAQGGVSIHTGTLQRDALEAAAKALEAQAKRQYALQRTQAIIDEIKAIYEDIRQTIDLTANSIETMHRMRQRSAEF